MVVGIGVGDGCRWVDVTGWVWVGVTGWVWVGVTGWVWVGVTGWVWVGGCLREEFSHACWH